MAVAAFSACARCFFRFSYRSSLQIGMSRLRPHRRGSNHRRGSAIYVDRRAREVAGWL